MSSLMDLISQHISKDQVSQIAQRIGATPEQTESAISIAVPTLLGAAARKADSPEGAQQLHQTLQQHDGSILDTLSGMFGGGADQTLGSALGGGNTDGGSGLGGLLGSLLGSRQGKVEQGIGSASGLNAMQIGSLLAMLAPIVMGAIGRHQKSQNMDADVLAGSLRKEKESLENQPSGGMLAGLLDQDGDGDVDLQDIMKLGMKKLFGR